MKCAQVKELFADWVADALKPTDRADLELHLKQCADCHKEAEGMRLTWEKLGTLTVGEPSRDLDSRFYAMLEAYQQGAKHSHERKPSTRLNLKEWLGRIWPRQPAMQFGAAFALFVVGLSLGAGLNWPTQHRQAQEPSGAAAMAELKTEITGIKEMLAVSLLQQPSASERLRGVAYGGLLDHPDDRVMGALLQALNSDSNVNVRLAAIDALRPFLGQETVRKGVIESIARERSPLVQVELINLMVGSKVKEAAPALRSLLQQTELDKAVRDRAELGLQQLG